MIRTGIEIDEFLHRAARYLYGENGTFFDDTDYPGFGWAQPLPAQDKRYLRRQLTLPDNGEFETPRVVILRNLIVPPSWAGGKPESSFLLEHNRGFQFVRQVHLESLRGGKLWACACQGYQFHVTEGNTWAERDIVDQVAMAKGELWSHI